MPLVHLFLGNSFNSPIEHVMCHISLKTLSVARGIKHMLKEAEGAEFEWFLVSLIFMNHQNTALSSSVGDRTVCKTLT